MRTLEDWRTNLKKDDDWRPYSNRNAHRLLLTDDEEAELAQVIRTEFIATDTYCPSCRVFLMAKNLWLKNRPDANDTPQFSYTWFTRFLSQHGLSLRKPHVKRRTEPDDEVVADFLADMDWIRIAFAPDHVLNVDETCWRVINGYLRTVAEIGAEDVNCKFPCDEKLSLTVIACIASSGEKLPLWILVKGKTKRCEGKITKTSEYNAEAVRRGDLFITHSETGWVDGDVAVKYLTWLRGRMAGPIALVWDVFAAHRDCDVKREAMEQEITLAYIPAGQTDYWQPLDRRIFGNLKQRGVGRWNAQFLREEQPELSVATAATILLKSWESIGQDEIQDAWEHFT